MNVVIDIGNTRSKYAFFDGRDLLSYGFDPQDLVAQLRGIAGQKEEINLFLSGSGKIVPQLREALKEQATFWLEAGTELELPIEIGYKTPETLGFDRIAICVGAHALFPGQELLVIDSGTAITYNYVSREGCFLGGNIAPGVETRFKSLHRYTDKLPCLEPTVEYGGYGRSTREAIVNGVMLGMLFEVEKYIEHFLARKENQQVLLTGGGSVYLKNKLNFPVYMEKHLGFIGLNEILEYSKKRS